MIFINGYLIDVAVTEEHAFENDITDHPVERGTSISDHIRARPNTLSIEGLVSDTPIGEARSFREQQADGAIPSREAFAKIMEFRDSRELLTITTSLRDYDDMVVQSISVPRDAKTGAALRFKATFKQIRIVDTERSTVKISVPVAKKKRDKGTVPAKTEGDVPAVSAKTEEYRSSLLNLQDGAKEIARELASD